MASDSPTLLSLLDEACAYAEGESYGAEATGDRAEAEKQYRRATALRAAHIRLRERLAETNENDTGLLRAERLALLYVNGGPS